MENNKKTINVYAGHDLQLQDYIKRLDAAGAQYRVETDTAGKPYLVVLEDDARTILGVTPHSKRQTAFTIIFALCFTFGILFGVVRCINSITTPKEPATLAEKMERDFGLSSKWFNSYAVQAAQSLRNPSSYRTEEVRVIPIDEDSITHVLIYSGVNDFNVRKIQSITTVVNAKTGQIQRVVSHNQE